MMTSQVVSLSDSMVVGLCSSIYGKFLCRGKVVKSCGRLCKFEQDNNKTRKDLLLLGVVQAP